MASQQIIFAETIAAIKRNLKRKTYESDSDDSIDHNGNRGQKLKKRARFTRQGQLAPPTGPEEVEYAGTRRSIINRNPPLIDDDGFEVDSEDDEERFQDALANAADTNPYANIHLERILAPLTSVTDLANHPSLATAYNSKSLTQLANQASELMRKEQHALSKVKKLMTGFCGDYTWIPCGLLVGPNDIELYRDDSAFQDFIRERLLTEAKPNTSSPATLNGAKKTTVNGTSTAATGLPTKDSEGKAAAVEDITMGDAGGPQVEKSDTDKEPGDTETLDKESKADKPREGTGPDKLEVLNSTGASAEPALTANPSEKLTNSEESGKADTGSRKAAENAVEMKDADSTSSNSESNNSRANVEVRQRSASADADSDDFPVHPFFAPPSYPRSDKDMGLPENEAEHVRQLLSHYVQKQEEVCRGAIKLYFNLLKADRLRHEVFKWSKAEGHVGELSDGEDWYDMEEWKLTEDLKKGQDEEEEDTLPVGKKTRNRRN
ncbi:hypothetical protein jhhlp_003196 [Lomentospora prolificans]|uniref:Transcriptional regulatory protein RXT2 N-terminal domain-containing protein n=1 Tax=Lomentospora prolificans TaxID=41688 RepID=A0A2N3NG71_9PEZI|nr:hypothetical protein jhhlp_003196 [Lomentospora prolificans]